jgi:hypothetical protein
MSVDTNHLVKAETFPADMETDKRRTTVITVRELDFYYGETPRSKRNNVRYIQAQSDGVHRPVRLRKVDPAPLLQPDERLD